MELMLNKGEVMSLGNSMRKGHVTCTRGACWLTCAGQPGDHLLRPGESLHVEGGGPLVLNALKNCAVEIQPAPVNRTVMLETLPQAI